MPLTKIAISSDRGLLGPGASAERRTDPQLRVGTTDRDHLLERLQHLRGILPVFAQELASARRQAASLRVENRGLLEEVRRLRAQRGESGRRSRPRFDEDGARMGSHDGGRGSRVLEQVAG